MIYRRHLLLIQPYLRPGMILHLLLVTSGSAGLLRARKRKREIFALRKHSRNLRVGCVDLVVGVVARTDKTSIFDILLGMKKAKDVDEYIANAPKEVQGKLKELRGAIKSVAPEATEKISYGMPNYGSYKRGWASFAYFRDHFSLFITPGVLDDFKSETETIRTGKATLRFSLDKKLPLALIKKLVKATIRKNEARE